MNYNEKLEKVVKFLSNLSTIVAMIVVGIFGFILSNYEMKTKYNDDIQIWSSIDKVDPDLSEALGSANDSEKLGDTNIIVVEKPDLITEIPTATATPIATPTATLKKDSIFFETLRIKNYGYATGRMKSKVTSFIEIKYKDTVNNNMEPLLIPLNGYFEEKQKISLTIEDQKYTNKINLKLIDVFVKVFKNKFESCDFCKISIRHYIVVKSKPVELTNITSKVKNYYYTYSMVRDNGIWIMNEPNENEDDETIDFFDISIGKKEYETATSKVENLKSIDVSEENLNESNMEKQINNINSIKKYLQE
jgi:hypothetical protein